MREKVKFKSPEDLRKVDLRLGDSIELFSQYYIDLNLSKDEARHIDKHIAFVHAAYEIIHARHLEMVAEVEALAAQQEIVYQNIPSYGEYTPRPSLWERIKNVF